MEMDPWSRVSHRELIFWDGQASCDAARRRDEKRHLKRALGETEAEARRKGSIYFFGIEKWIHNVYACAYLHLFIFMENIIEQTK